jgi:hypothetical protein
MTAMSVLLNFLFHPPQCLAHIEAFIDFSEDELIEDGVISQGGYTAVVFSDGSGRGSFLRCGVGACE